MHLECVIITFNHGFSCLMFVAALGRYHSPGKLAIFFLNPKQIATPMFLHFCRGQIFTYGISKVGQNRKI